MTHTLPCRCDESTAVYSTPHAPGCPHFLEPAPERDPSPAVLAHMRKGDRLLRRLADIVTDSEELVDQPDARRALDDIDRHLERGRRL